ncbi:hypothetical protein X551_03400 [Methylibium sp. T29]|nr:hypothetical protein X551_03400 [Methylibium sp. T29]EWS58254.1 hypothetical protein Y694_03863 [Methylibium sp. T29-B]
MRRATRTAGATVASLACGRNSRIAKAVPRPGVLRTVISPPIRSVSIFAMVRPMPVPCPPPASAPPRSKGSNTRASSSDVMPGPESSISKCAISRA